MVSFYYFLLAMVYIMNTVHLANVMIVCNNILTFANLCKFFQHFYFILLQHLFYFILHVLVA